MATKLLKRSRDPVQLAKLIGDIATGHFDKEEDKRNPAAVALGKLGGERAGKPRHEALGAT